VRCRGLVSRSTTRTKPELTFLLTLSTKAEGTPKREDMVVVTGQEGKEVAEDNDNRI